MDPLTHQLRDAVLDPLGSAGVAKAARKLAQDAGLLLGALQQQGPGLAGNRAAVKTGYRLPAESGSKTETCLVTLCPSEKSFVAGCNIFIYIRLCHNQRLFATTSVRNPGYETILKYLRTTRTATGLRVRAHLVRKTYKTGVKVTDEEMQELRITPDSSMPKWNYTIEPM